MSKRGYVTLVLTLFCTGMAGILLSQSGVLKGSTSSQPVFDAGVVVKPEAKHRGISWVGSDPVTAEHLAPLLEVGANWIIQTPFSWQKGHDSPHLRLANTGHLWGEADTGLKETTVLAKKAGLLVMLKPHIWITQAQEGKWRSDIAMSSDADWAVWWENYRNFMLHYAKLAQEQNMEALCVGTELSQTVVSQEKQWRQLIADIRAIYTGRLIYAANWYEEYEDVPFWDALDWIGIQAYFPLTQQVDASVSDLAKGWVPHLERIADVARKFNKPVIFTEVGYRATADAAIEPWRWPRRMAAEPEGLKAQARCYEAFFQAVWHQPWFAGAYIWKWHPHLGVTRFHEQPREGFSPQQKPAEEVLSQAYKRYQSGQ